SRGSPRAEGSTMPVNLGRRELIAALGSAAAWPLAARAQGSEVYDPVGSGFVTNLARPEANVTGFSLGEFSLGGKMLGVLREVAPQVSRVAVILDLDQPPAVAIWYALESTAAPSFGVRVTAVDMHSEIEGVIGDFAHEPNGGLIVLPGPFVHGH